MTPGTSPQGRWLSLRVSLGRRHWRSLRVSLRPGRAHPLRRTLLAALVAGLVPWTLPPAVLAQGAGDGTGIEGPVWQLVSYRGEAGAVQVPPGVAAEVILFAGSARGTDGCGLFTMAYTLDDETVSFAIPEAVATSCDPQAAPVQAAFREALPEVVFWAVDGSRLSMLDGDRSPLLVLSSATLEPNPARAPWLLAGLPGADGSSRSPAAGAAPLRLVFAGDGTLQGSGPCGTFSGTWDLAEEVISIGPLSAQPTDCGPQETADAEAVLAALPLARRLSVTATGLALSDEQGGNRLAWAPDLPLEAGVWVPVSVGSPPGSAPVDRDLLPGLPIAFEAGRVSGRSPCHAFTADYTADGLALTITDVEADRGPCRERKSDASFLAALRRVASMAWDGAQLELRTADDGRALLLEPQPPLAGLEWTVSSLDVAGSDQAARLRPPLRDTRLAVAFDAGAGLVEGRGGCNLFAANYEVSGPSISITDILPTDRDRNCERRVLDQETRFFRLLRDATGYVVRPERLELYDGDRLTVTLRPPR